MQLQNCLLTLMTSLNVVTAISADSLTHSSLSVSSNNTSIPSFQACNCITGARYLTRKTLHDVLEEQFCTETSLQHLTDHKTSIMETYNQGTPEEVAIMIDWKNKPDFRPNIHDCLRFLHDMVMDGCNGNDPENPMNWKGGGLLQVDDVTYGIDPLSLRPPAPEEPRGGCTVTHHEYYHHLLIWGAGWASSDSGEKLESELKNSGLLPDTFNFEYGLGGDGREWNVTMYTTAWNDTSVTDAARKAGAQDGFKCSEKGIE
jgi:hypothetical protein